jgi:MFS family permease
MGRLADRFGIRVPLIVAAAMLGLGCIAAASASAYWQFVLAQAVLIGMLGSSASFGSLVADVSQWFPARIPARMRPASHTQLTLLFCLRCWSNRGG